MVTNKHFSNNESEDLNLFGQLTISEWGATNPILADWLESAEWYKDSSNRERFSQTSSVNYVQVYFGNIEKYLCEKIKQYPIILGCVAWLTNENVLEVLATRERVQIIIEKSQQIVGKQDNGSFAQAKLRKLYSSLPAGISTSKEYWGDLINVLNLAVAWKSAPIRCAGVNYPARDGQSTFPRMHNKFLLFCDYCKPGETNTSLIPNERFLRIPDDTQLISVKAVWTGSFNLTENATKSLENSIFIEECEHEDNLDAWSPLELYYEEWQRIFATSEALLSDLWERKYDAPDRFVVGF